MNKGTYSLLVKLEEEAEIPINKKKYLFPSGYYVYVGSGMNGLQSRIRRHLSADKKKKWHIDFLLEKGKVIDISKIHSSKRLECSVSDAFKKKGSSFVVEKFGSTDCKCNSHLHYFEEIPKGGLRIKVR